MSVEVELHLLSTHTNSYFSGQSCRTWKRFVALLAVFWWTDQYTLIQIKTSELSLTEQAGKIRKCILNEMIKCYNKQPNIIFFLYVIIKSFYESIVGIYYYYWYSFNLTKNETLAFFLCLVKLCGSWSNLLDMRRIYNIIRWHYSIFQRWTLLKTIKVAIHKQKLVWVKNQNN